MRSAGPFHTETVSAIADLVRTAFGEDVWVREEKAAGRRRGLHAGTG